MVNIRLYGGWAAHGPEGDDLALGLRWFPYSSWSEERIRYVSDDINWSMDAWEFA